MNILHISPTHYSDESVIGGGEKYVIYCAKALFRAANKRGRRSSVSLLAFGSRSAVVRLSDEVICNVIEGRPWDASSLSADLIRHELKDFDVVFVHQCLTGFGLFLASQAKIAGKAVIGLDHGGGEHSIVTRTSKCGVLFDAFQAYSTFGSKAFVDVEGRVIVAPGPVDDEYYTPGLNLPVDPHKVIALGRIMPHKGFDRTIAALPDGLSLHIIGRSYDTAYQAHLHELAKGKAVYFHPHLDDDQTRSVLQTAGLFVHASTHVDYRGTYYAKPELLGLAPLEALCCGVPTLVSSAGSLPELSRVDGCMTFANDLELAALLARHRSGDLPWPERSHIHDDVSTKYGLVAYGNYMLDQIEQIFP